MAGFNYADLVEIAIKICNEEEFKIAVFFEFNSDKENPKERKASWDKLVENKALSLLGAYDLETDQQEILIGAVFSVAMRMLIWIEYHIGTFNFSRYFCCAFLEPTLFTPEGVIDHKKVAIKMSETSFSNLQNFKLACFYCHVERIPNLFKNLSEKEKILVYNENNPELIKQPDIIKFWTFYYKGNPEKLGGNLKTNEQRLQSAITSGSRVAIKFCLKRQSPISKQRNVVDAAVSIIKHRMDRELEAQEQYSNVVKDSVVFRNSKYDPEKDSWTPDCFLVDIFYWLLSKMSESQKAELLEKLFNIVAFDILNVKSSAYVDHPVLSASSHPVIILCWPYQDKIFELLTLSWTHLPKRAFGGLILEILSRIETEQGHFWYGEDKICKYKKFLMKIWTACPESLKRYIFRDKIRYLNQNGIKGEMIIKEGKVLLFRMFHLNHFTEDDRRNVISVIGSATKEERMEFLLSSEGIEVCTMLILKSKLDLFEELLSICFQSSEQLRAFRNKFSYMKAKHACLELIQNERFDEAEEILKWGELTEEEMEKLKQEIISRADGRITCRELCLIKPNTADKFVRWCYPSEKSINDFKYSLLFNDDGVSRCISLLKNGDFHLADKLVNWCLSSQEDIKKFKELVPFLIGDDNFNIVVFEVSNDDVFPYVMVDWNASKSLLSWCFKTESDLNNFKRKFILYSKNRIIFKCAELNKWDVADKFISWLNLSPDKIKALKKEIFFNCPSTSDLFDNLMFRAENDIHFSKYGGKQETIKQFLSWFLVDEESITEFTTRYRCYRTDQMVQNIIDKLNEANL